MIGKLRGRVDAIGESHLIIDVGGVGYEVQASSRTLRNLKHGDEASLTIDMYVREDAIKLFGFTSEVERTWFRTLQTIQGVGAKVALGVLGTLAPNELAHAIALGNWQAIEQTNGVGKKLAQRIVMELKDKAPGMPIVGIAGPASKGGAIKAPGVGVDPATIAQSEAISALSNLGYQPMQAAAAVAAAVQELGAEADVAKLIRRWLKELAK